MKQKHDKFPDNCFMVWAHCDCNKCDKNLKKYFPYQHKMKKNGNI